MFKQVNVDTETFKLIDKFSKEFGVKKYQIVKTFMKFFKDNRPYLSTEFFECEDYKNLKAIDEKMEKMVSKIVKKETNTLIRFIRTQDKFMETMKRDLMYKVNPSREDEYHPLFDKYDFVIEYFELFIGSLGKDLDDVVEEIKNREGIEIAKEFQNNLYNIKGKTLEY